MKWVRRLRGIMNKNKRIQFEDKEIKFPLGYIEINVLYINYEPPIAGRYFDFHSHGTYELHYIPQGEGLLNVDHCQYKIVPGTFFLTGPGVFHEQIADSNSPMSEYCLNFEFKLLKKQTSYTRYNNRNEIDAIASQLQKNKFWFGKDDFNTFELFVRLFNELESKLLGYESTLHNMVSQIIVNSVRSFALEKNAGYDIPVKLSSDKRRAIIDNYFRNCHKDLTPLELANHLGISTRQLNRLIRKYYSMSFKQKLLKTRVEIACDLLINTSFTIENITHSIGFCNPSHFYKIFIKFVGDTPSEYRKRGRRSPSGHE